MSRTSGRDLISLIGEALKHPQCITLFSPIVDAVDHRKFDTLDEAKVATEDLEKKVRSGTLYECTSNIAYGKGCGRISALGKSKGILTHSYVEPYGCTGGDYYAAGELHVLCPKCGHRNRTFNTPGKHIIRGSLASVEDEYRG